MTTGLEQAWESVYCCRPYHPYRIYGDKNPAFDKGTDGRLLDLKEGKRYAIRAEAKYLAEVMEALRISGGTILAMIPGHTARSSNRGTPLARLIDELAKRDERLVPMCDALIRFKDIDKLASGGNRSVDVHLESMRAGDAATIDGNTVVMLDDVVTTGNSMEAARRLVAEAGATRVAGLAIGRTA